MLFTRIWRTGLFIVLTLFITINAHAVSVGDTAPDFTLKNMQGKNMNLTEQRGNIMLINFWASWCGPCRKEMPVLQALEDKYKDLGVQVWGINVEQESQAGKDFLANLSLNFSIFFDETNTLSKTYQVEAMPTTVIVDRDGVVRFVYLGYKDGYGKKYEKAIKQLIRE